MLTYQPETKPQPQLPESKLPVDYQPAMSNLDAGFDDDEFQKLIQYDLAPPSSVLQASMQGDIDIKDYDANIGKMLKNLEQRRVLYQRAKERPRIKTKLIK